MLDGLPVSALANGVGVVGVIVLIGYLVITDRLQPAARVRQMRADYEARAEQLRADFEGRLSDVRADKDAQIVLWRAVAETAQAQTGELMENSRMTVDLLRSLNSRASRTPAGEV